MSEELIIAVVLSTIMWEGERIFPSKTEEPVCVELPAKEFKRLESFGAVTELNGVKDDGTISAVATTDGLNLEEDERLFLLVGYIADLDPNNEEHFTKGGKPEVKVLEDKAGFNVTAAERDNAWEAFVAEQKNAGTGNAE